MDRTDPMLQLDDAPNALPIQDVPGTVTPVAETIIRPSELAEAKMQENQEAETLHHESIANALMQRIEEMSQADHGATLRIEELERQRDFLKEAMRHINQVHMSSRGEYELAVFKLQEASQQQHVRDREANEPPLMQLNHLRREAATGYVQYEERAQGEGLNMAREYENLANELNEMARENMQLKAAGSCSEVVVQKMKDKLQAAKEEGLYVASEIRVEVDDVKMGILREQDMALRQRAEYNMAHDRLVQHLRREEEMQSAVRLQMQDAEMQLQARFTECQALPAIQSQVMELRQKLKLKEEMYEKVRSELELQRCIPLQLSSQAPSLPLSSKTSESIHQFGMMYTKSPFVTHWLIAEDVRNADARSVGQPFVPSASRPDPSNGTQAIQEDRKNVEKDYIAPMVELRVLLQQAQENERRLRDERNEWRQTAVYLQELADQEQGDDEEDDEECDSSVHPSDCPNGGSGPPDSPSRRGADPPKTPKGRDVPGDEPPDPPPPGDPDGRDDPEITEVKISRREADKVVVPPFPRALNESGHIKFKSIDVKLAAAMAMTSLLRTAGDQASDLLFEVIRKADQYVRSSSWKIIKGRQIIAMMYESFRTRDRLDLIVTLEQTRTPDQVTVISRMRPEDVPSETALRDALHSKINHSPTLKMELLVHDDMLPYDHQGRTYQNLLGVIDRCVMRQRENKNQAQTHHGLRQMIEGKDNLAAPANTANKDNEKESATPAPKKGAKSNTKNEEAAPVLPQSKAKGHAKAKHKDKRQKDKDRSQSNDDKKGERSLEHGRCNFFLSERGECPNGDRCPFSHSKKTPPSRGRDGSRSPGRSRSSSQSTSTKHKVCYLFKNTGSCRRENCPLHTSAILLQPKQQRLRQRPRSKQKPKQSQKPKQREEPKERQKLSQQLPPFDYFCRAWNPLAPAVRKRAVTYDDEESDCSSLDSDADSDCSTEDEAEGVTSSTSFHSKGKRVQYPFPTQCDFSRTKGEGEKVKPVNVNAIIDSDDRAAELGFAKHIARIKDDLGYDSQR
ncbi:unnamed protein product [Symbiodinium sp. CCMP2456]|nr:unnamed protein product [Symbiodinium sp. CCMP2456]